MNKKYDLVVFFGRFQPLHYGHIHLIEHAFRLSNNLVMLCGSAQESRTIKNPMNFNEREAMIRECVKLKPYQKLFIEPIADTKTDEEWREIALSVVYTITSNIKLNSDEMPKIAIVGYFKDESSYYLNIFPEWDLVEVENYNKISATNIRRALLDNQLSALEELLPEPALFEIKSIMAKLTIN
ncbi:MAG: adenylyltransferase/cytidyltransferase family protein [Alphaproteobacteria bacterium]|nr:adenylyltransferase/cytidyltransferase family protein [Alphaproteobacteria bacterium]OJV15119.1 MAG: hypothetical protein BGO27_06745 [Alphaproteobacteria bacterium 33-17]